jgi:hypothetical protein
MAASAGTGQRGAHDGALVKKEAKGRTLSGKRKGPSQAKREVSGMYTPFHSLYFFFLHIHVRSTLPSTSKHTEGSTMAAPGPHLSKGKESMKDKINNSRCTGSGRLTRGTRITI